jgi:DNA-binding response OmpR family regulator
MEILKTKNVLFVEDNEEFAQNFIMLLDLFVHTIWHCKDLFSAREYFQHEKVDIIICDIKLHHENGLNFIEEVRKIETHMPIIVLSGNKNEEFLFRAIPLNLIAYLLKPIKYKDFVTSLEKCAKVFNKGDEVILKSGDMFDKHNQSLYLKNGTTIELSKKETAFLALLIENQNQIVTKDMVLESVWNFEEMSEGAIANFIMRLRKKIGKNFIHTVAESGYKLGM